MQTSKSTSWQPVHRWYEQEVGLSGHYYHQHVVLPNTKKLLALSDDSSLLDLACGQGVLAREVSCTYQGIDISRSLIDYAKTHNPRPNHRFAVGDITKTLPINKTDFTHAAIILALQNISDPAAAVKNVSHYLAPAGRLVLVLNHPCFRIPRQSSWEIDETNKLQYRRINRYLSPLEIPITAHPGQAQSPHTLSFHHPLSDYSRYLSEAGFVIESLEEWISDKDSVGSAAKMENLARREFPLFLAISARKV